MTTPIVNDRRAIVHDMNRDLAIRRALAYGRPAWCVSVALLVCLLLVMMAGAIVAGRGAAQTTGVEMVSE